MAIAHSSPTKQAKIDSGLSNASLNSVTVEDKHYQAVDKSTTLNVLNSVYPMLSYMFLM